MTKTKCLKAIGNFEILEKVINDWIDENPTKTIVDIKYNVAVIGGTRCEHYAMIIYKI